VRSCLYLLGLLAGFATRAAGQSGIYGSSRGSFKKAIRLDSPAAVPLHRTGKDARQAGKVLEPFPFSRKSGGLGSP